MKKYHNVLLKCGRSSFRRFGGVRVAVAKWLDKLVMRLCLWKLDVLSQPSSFYSYWDLDVQTDGKAEFYW